MDSARSRPETDRARHGRTRAGRLAEKLATRGMRSVHSDRKPPKRRLHSQKYGAVKSGRPDISEEKC